MLVVRKTSSGVARECFASYAGGAPRPRTRGLEHDVDVFPRIVWTGSHPRIIGGSDAAQADWGFVAFVAYFGASGNPEFTCSGTVVAPNVVLTAGHCAVGETTGSPLDPSGYVVATDSVDWTDALQRQLSTVSRVIVDPAYDPISDTFDAALTVLSTPTTAPVIPLASSADAYLEQGGTGALIAGWGATYDGGSAVTYLEWAPTVVQNPGHCSQFDPYLDSFSELCAVNPPDFSTGTCNSDSGAPIAADDASGTSRRDRTYHHGPSDCDTDTADDFTATGPLSSWVADWSQAVAPPPTATLSAPSPSPSSTPPTQQPSSPALPRLSPSAAGTTSG